MPKGYVEEGSDWRYEEGESTVRLRDVKEDVVQFTYRSNHQAVKQGRANVGDPGEFSQWLWDYEYLDGPNVGQRITVRTSAGVTLKGFSPAREMFEALQNGPVEIGQEVDTDNVIGLCAKANTVNYTESDRNDPSKVYYRSRLQDFYPAEEPADADPWPSTGGSGYPEEPPF